MTKIVLDKYILDYGDPSYIGFFQFSTGMIVIFTDISGQFWKML